MRKIEAQMIIAINRLQSWYGGNTQVTVESDPRGTSPHVVTVCLHGHKIARIEIGHGHKLRDLRVCLAGWDTRTTRSRLTALMRGLKPIPAHHYDSGLGVSTRKTKAGQDIRIHDRRGITPITVDGWHNVQL